MVLQINMILSASLGMTNYHWPIPEDYPSNLKL